jgi:hypothetical protein
LEPGERILQVCLGFNPALIDVTVKRLFGGPFLLLGKAGFYGSGSLLVLEPRFFFHELEIVGLKKPNR